MSHSRGPARLRRRHFALVLPDSSVVLRGRQACNTVFYVKTLTVRLPDSMVAEIEEESRKRKVSKSDIVRARLQSGPRLGQRRSTMLDSIADLIGSVEGPPEDLSARMKHYLKSTGYGRKRPR